MIKNNRGFTLIELIVVIAIMASILVIAIVSLNGISKKKKEESYEKVKEQIVVAAKEYVETNEYLFEDLKDADVGSSKTISLKTLVSEDYLNTLTNPETGKKLDECSNVIVTKKSHNSYAYEFDDTSNTCYNTTTIVVSEKEPKSPILSISKTCYVDEAVVTNDWCKGTITYNVTAQTNGGSSIKRVTAYLDENYESFLTYSDSNNLSFDIEDQTGINGRTLYFKAVNEDNLDNAGASTYKIDKTPPTCTVSSEAGGNNYTGNWTNKNITFKGACSDTLSGCKTDEINITRNDTFINKNLDLGNVVDNAGNSTNCYGNAMIDKIKPTVTINSSGSSNQNRTFTLTSTDTTDTYPNQSGIKKTEYKINGGTYQTYSSKVTALTNTGVAKVTAKTYDNAGNVSNEVSTELVCNKDKVSVTPELHSSYFYLNFSQPDWEGTSASGYEYIIWNKSSTNDKVKQAKSKNYNIDGTNYKYDSYMVAKEKCGDFASKTATKITGNTTSEINITTATDDNSYYAMYYCLAVRPVRSNRSNLKGIGNYFRSTLEQPTSEKTVSNTGWTIQYKHVSTGDS